MARRARSVRVQQPDRPLLPRVIVGRSRALSLRARRGRRTIEQDTRAISGNLESASEQHGDGTSTVTCRVITCDPAEV